MKFVLLVASTLVTGLTAVGERAPPAWASPRGAGACVEVRESFPALAAGESASVTSESATPGPDFEERGPAPWQKDRATREAERDQVLDRELGDDR